MTPTGETETTAGGLQPERTSLAWTRLGLTLLALALGLVQVGWPILGGWTLVPAAAVAGGAIVLLAGAHQRYATSLPSPGRQRVAARPDGRLIATTAVSVLVLAAVAALVVAGSGP